MRCTQWSFWGQRVQDAVCGVDFSLLPLAMAMGMLAHCISLPPREVHSSQANPPQVSSANQLTELSSCQAFTALVESTPDMFVFILPLFFDHAFWKYCVLSKIFCLTSCILYMYITVHHPYNPVSCFFQVHSLCDFTSQRHIALPNLTVPSVLLSVLTLASLTAQHFVST